MKTDLWLFSRTILAPRYLLVEFEAAEQEQVARDEDLFSVSQKLIDKTEKHMRSLQNDNFK